MYLKELRKMDTADLMSIRDDLRQLKTTVFNLQSLDANLKKKRKGFNKTTRSELRKMFKFRERSTDKIEQVLRERRKR